MTWQTRAACAGTNPEVFYADSNVPGINDATRYKEAARICAGCPVRALCLKEALLDETAQGLGHVHGYRGGRSPKQRKKLITSARAAGTARARCSRCGGTFAWSLNAKHCAPCSAELARSHDKQPQPPRFGECAGCGREMRLRARGMCSTCCNHKVRAHVSGSTARDLITAVTQEVAA